MLILHVTAQQDARYTLEFLIMPLDGDRLVRNRCVCFSLLTQVRHVDMTRFIIWHLTFRLVLGGAGQTRGCSGSLELSWVSITESSWYGSGYGLRNGLVRLVIGTRVGVAGLLASGPEMAVLPDVASPPVAFRWLGSRPAGWTCGSASCSCSGWTAVCPRSLHCSPAKDAGASGPQQSTCSPSSCAISS